MKIYEVAAAMVWRENEIAMVRQPAPEGQAGAFWVLPGGKVEAGETYDQAVMREVREETGLTVLSAPDHVYDCVYKNAAQHFECRVKMYTCAVTAGVLCVDDPDGDVEAAAFFSVPVVLEKLAALPWVMVREPAIAFLRGTAAQGSVWRYEADENGLYRRI